jgi:hypothetical protein
MHHIRTEARRVPLRIQLLGPARRHATEYALDPAMAIEDVQTLLGGLASMILKSSTRTQPCK